TSSGKLCAVADCNVVRNAHAPAKHHHIADRHRPRYASIPGNHAGAADLHIMRDLHKIIDLAALANDRVRQGAAINCGIRSDLNVVLDDDTPDLWVLFKALWSREKAETVLPHLRARMDNHPVADDSELNRGLRADETVAADRAAVSNHGIGPDDGATPDGDILANDGTRLDDHAIFDQRAGRNKRVGRHSRLAGNRLGSSSIGKKKSRNLRKGRLRALRNKYGNASWNVVHQFFVAQHSSCAH